MQVQAQLKGANMSAQKVRLVADEIRGRGILDALELLQYSPKKAAYLVRKVLSSAVANAEHNENADIDALVVHLVYVDEGRMMKRARARAKGRSCRILKRSCHITVVVSDEATHKRRGK